MPTTPLIGMVLPTDHSDADVWGVLLNSALTLADLHDHTTGKGAPIPAAALKINADIAWSFAGTTYAITQMKALDFTPTSAASITSYASALFVNSSDANNLYFRNESGTNVKITDGSTLNVSIVGGIGGDYSSVGALLDYDDASDTYRFRQETAASVRQYAKMAHADIALFEYDAAGDASVPVNAVTIKSPDALAAGYTLTLLAALPGSTSFLKVSTAGQVTASNAATSTYTLNLSANSGFGFTAAGVWALSDSVGASGHFNFPADVPEGATITSWQTVINKGTNGSNTVTARMFRVDSTTGTATGLGSAQTNSANAPGLITLQETGVTYTAGTNETFYIDIDMSAYVGGSVETPVGAKVVVSCPLTLTA